ncbi:MAG: hypothetical protein ACK50Q_04275, partial [Labrys sp. (in: a-proteobacteria)]
SGLAGGSNDVANFGGGDVSSCHDLYRSGKITQLPTSVDKICPDRESSFQGGAPLDETNPIGKMISSRPRCLNQPRSRQHHIAERFEPGATRLVRRLDVALRAPTNKAVRKNWLSG